MEGDGAGQVARLGHAISTHALTWRATITVISTERSLGISTHALTWRATNVLLYVNPCNVISTHALA